MGILEWSCLGTSYNTERKPCRIITARDDCVVTKFSISLVCSLRAQAADTVTFCFCLWELFNFTKQRVSEITFHNRAKMIIKICVEQNYAEETLASWDTNNYKVQEDLPIIRVVFSSRVSHDG